MLSPSQFQAITPTVDAPDRLRTLLSWHGLHPSDLAHYDAQGFSQRVLSDNALCTSALSVPPLREQAADVLGVSGRWLATGQYPMSPRVQFDTLRELAMAFTTLDSLPLSFLGSTTEQLHPFVGRPGFLELWLSPPRRPAQFIVVERAYHEAGGPEHETRLLRYVSGQSGVPQAPTTWGGVQSFAQEWADLQVLRRAGWIWDVWRTSAAAWDGVLDGTQHLMTARRTAATPPRAWSEDALPASLVMLPFQVWQDLYSQVARAWQQARDSS